MDGSFQKLKVHSTQHRVFAVSVFGIVVMAVGKYPVSGYLDPWGQYVGTWLIHAARGGQPFLKCARQVFILP